MFPALFTHFKVILFRAGKLFSKKYTVYKSQRLNKFKKKQYKTTANLLTGTILYHWCYSFNLTWTWLHLWSWLSLLWSWLWSWHIVRIHFLNRIFTSILALICTLGFVLEFGFGLGFGLGLDLSFLHSLLWS